MDVLPVKNQLGDYDEEGDLCRICRAPEGPDNPLRYPCACRGSIKYIHQKCLLLWLSLKENKQKQCELCGRSYSFVPVYAENAPGRLPWNVFMKGLLLRALRLFAWVLVILFNVYCFPLHPLGRETAVGSQRVFRVSERFGFLLAGFLYHGLIAFYMTMVVYLRLSFEYHFRRRRRVENNRLGHGVVAGVALVLWKYMRILCDWYHDHLVERWFFYAIMGVELGEEVVARPQHAELHEFGAARRFLFLFGDNAFAVLAISSCISFFFVLLPFVLGKLVFRLLLLFPRMELAMQLLSRDSFGQEPVIVGYMIMVALTFAYLGSFVPLCRDTVVFIAVGFIMIAAAIPYLLWTLSVKVWRNLSVVKDGFILCLKFGVFPFVLGCWLDFCTFPIMGTTISSRLELLSEFPFLIIFHWMSGNFCLLFAFNSTALIHEIIPNRIWFLLDVSDQNYKITKLYLDQILFALAFHGTLMVIVVHLPIMCIAYLSPSLFPIQLWIYEEKNIIRAMAAYVCLSLVGVLEWLIKLIKSATKPLVHKWIVTVSSWLELTEFLFEKHADQNVRPLLEEELQIHNQWYIVFCIAEGSIGTFYGSQRANDTTFQVDFDHDSFMLRIGLMLVLAVSSLFVISTMAMALPILMGRAFSHSISFIMLHFGLKHDDLYGFWIGCYILRAIFTRTCFIYNHIMTARTDLLLNLVVLWIRNTLLFSIWITIIPALLGLLIDLTIIIPLQVPLNESSPVHSLIQDWLIGLVVLHIWTYLTMFTRINCFTTVAFREKLERIKNVGINQLACTWLLLNVFCSIIGTLLITLIFPFLVAYFLLPLLGFSEAVNFTVQRLIWPVLLAIIILGFIAKLTFKLFVYIHRVEYNDRYLVGDRVTDFIEDLEQGNNSEGKKQH